MDFEWQVVDQQQQQQQQQWGFLSCVHVFRCLIDSIQYLEQCLIKIKQNRASSRGRLGCDAV
jgi:hypothetical protein